MTKLIFIYISVFQTFACVETLCDTIYMQARPNTKKVMFRPDKRNKKMQDKKGMAQFRSNHGQSLRKS